MYCPFSKYEDGSFRYCQGRNCMAYNKRNSMCKLIDRETVINSPLFFNTTEEQYNGQNQIDCDLR